jgi:hypothetical protein
MEMKVLAWDRKQKTTETDGNVGFGMGQETENDRDGVGRRDRMVVGFTTAYAISAHHH